MASPHKHGDSCILKILLKSQTIKRQKQSCNTSIYLFLFHFFQKSIKTNKNLMVKTFTDILPSKRLKLSQYEVPKWRLMKTYGKQPNSRGKKSRHCLKAVQHLLYLKKHTNRWYAYHTVHTYTAYQRKTLNTSYIYFQRHSFA